MLPHLGCIEGFLDHAVVFEVSELLGDVIVAEISESVCPRLWLQLERQVDLVAIVMTHL